LQHAISGYRTVFISDVHLGSPGCRATQLLRFLDAVAAETLYLVGDIVDAESLARRFYWPDAHNEVLARLLAAARGGTRVIYVPGNHDAQARAFCGQRLGRIEVQRHALHAAADGRRYLVVHGDEFDAHLGRGTDWSHRIGALVYRQLLRLNGRVNDWRDRAGRDYWPVASAIKHRSVRAVRYMERFRAAALAAAAARGVDGCVVGHIHRPEAFESAATAYLNCGDWVEHCTALGERADGRVELVNGAAAPLPAVAAAPLPRAA
jgi:UDP-2,3-diacylglucosamine pyrophosphatase LpxH